MEIKNMVKKIGDSIAIINPLANVYSTHRKYIGLFSKLRTFMGINLFVSPTTLLLATLLKKIGYHPSIYDDVEVMIDPRIVHEDTILISIMTTTAKRGYEIARLFQDRRVIIGGVHASMLPEEAARHADQVVVGECERVLPDLIAGRIKERIVYAEPLTDLNDVPPLDYSILKVQPETLPMQTSRGCPFNCNFCSVTKLFGHKYRFRSPVSVLDELQNYRETYGEIKKIDFRLDANFTCKRDRAKEILRGMISRDIKPKVTAGHTRLDSFKDRELLQLMSQVNYTAYIGIESLDQDALNGYRKKQWISDIGEAIRVYHDHNIKVHAYLIFGADQDVPDTLNQYEEFIHASDLDTFTVTILTPHPGTELHDRLVSQKRIFTFNWDYFDGLHVTYEPARMSAHEMQKAFNEFYLRVFSLKKCLNPKLLFNIDKLKYKFFISQMGRILKNDMLNYTDLLKKQASLATPRPF